MELILILGAAAIVMLNNSKGGNTPGSSPMAMTY